MRWSQSGCVIADADAEMSEDINVRIAGQATSLGLVVYHLQRVTRDRIALREKILRP